jgi:ketosteroid isomerase-like protein
MLAMRLRNRLLFAFALLLAASLAALGQGAAAGASPKGGVAEEILRLEREYNEAYKRGDADVIERLHADDFRMTARGRVLERAALPARLRDRSTPRDVIESLIEDDVRVRDYGQTAVTTGRWKRVSKDAAGKDTSAEGFFTRVWVRRGTGWQLAVAHYSPAARPPGQQ